MSCIVNKDVSSRCVGLRKVAQPCANLYLPSIFMSILATFCLKPKTASTNQSIVTIVVELSQAWRSGVRKYNDAWSGPLILTEARKTCFWKKSAPDNADMTSPVATLLETEPKWSRSPSHYPFLSHISGDWVVTSIVPLRILPLKGELLRPQHNFVSSIDVLISVAKVPPLLFMLFVNHECKE